MTISTMPALPAGNNLPIVQCHTLAKYVCVNEDSTASPLFFIISSGHAQWNHLYIRRIFAGLPLKAICNIGFIPVNIFFKQLPKTARKLLLIKLIEFID